MNKNATLMSHLQNAAIAVLTVTAVLLLIQTPLVGDLAGKTPYELAQDWLAGDTSTDTAVTTDLTELALPVRVVFTNEYARYGLSAITTLDTDFELAGTFFGEALGSATTYEACSGEKLLTALHASSIYLDLEAPTPARSAQPHSRRQRRAGVLAPARHAACALPRGKRRNALLTGRQSGLFCQPDGDKQRDTARSARLARWQRHRFCVLALRRVLSALALHAHFQRTAAALHALGEQCPHRSGGISAPCGVQPPHGKRLHRLLRQHHYQRGLRHAAP